MNKTLYLILALSLFLNSNIFANEICDDTCPSELVKANNNLQHKEKNNIIYEVYSPVGEESIPKIQQPSRLNNLNGKTIAVVGVSFMSEITHPEIKRLILEKYPDSKVLLMDEIGYAGPYPAPGVIRREKEEFQKKLKQYKVDAVISGNGGCGLCTPKEEGSCIAAEYIGIPSVMIAAPGFVEQAQSTAYTAGMQVQRIAEYPGAFASHTKEELLRNTREILFPQIIKGLTEPITQEEIKKSERFASSKNDAVAFKGSLEDVNKYFVKRGWSDGLPFIPPTIERINEFLKYTDLKANTEIGAIPVGYRKVTVFEVAVVGVMSGCKPEYMPILIAFTKAMMNGEFRKTLSSTHAWTPYCWINGPIAKQLGFSNGQGEINNEANLRIGRFIDLALLNLGDYSVKKNRMGTFGYIASWCLSEDEDSAIKYGWKPYHVQLGYNLNDNTLTAASALLWGNNLTPSTSDSEKIMELMAWDISEKGQFALGSGNQFVNRTLLITEYVARDLASKFKSKESLEEALIQNARVPLLERAYARYWANPGGSKDEKGTSFKQMKFYIGRQEKSSETSVPEWQSWSQTRNIRTIPVMEKGKTAILVTGDPSRNKVMTLPGGGTVTIKIELPKNWNELMKQLGYKPLSD